MALDINFFKNEALEGVRHGVRYSAGLAVRKALPALAGVAMGFLKISSAFAAAGMGVITVGVGTAVTAYVNNKAHENRERRLAEAYKNEIGSILDIDPDKVEVSHLKTVAKGDPDKGIEPNPTLQDALDRSRIKRNTKTIIWTIAAAAAAFMVFGPLLPAVAGTGILAKATAVTMASVTGLASFLTTRHFVKPIAESIAKIDTPTVSEKVRDLEVQQAVGMYPITKEQVMEVFVAASPSLNNEIQRVYNKPYQKLNNEEKMSATLHFAPYTHIHEVTEALNGESVEGRMNARELTFRIHGQESGAYTDATFGERFKSGVSSMKEKLSHLRKKGVEKFQSFRNGYSADISEEVAPSAAPEAAPEVSFVERENQRGGGNQKTDNISWGEFINVPSGGASLAQGKR